MRARIHTKTRRRKVPREWKKLRGTRPGNHTAGFSILGHQASTDLALAQGMTHDEARRQAGNQAAATVTEQTKIHREPTATEEAPATAIATATMTATATAERHPSLHFCDADGDNFVAFAEFGPAVVIEQNQAASA